MNKVFLLFCCFAQLSLLSGRSIHVLLLSGRNNHDWKSTTPVLQNLYASHPQFEVTITEDPAALSAIDLEPFDVIVSNWCAWPDVTGRQWGSEFEEAFLNFVLSGKGFVLFHAASATFHDWPEYQRLVGATWELGKTGHGEVHVFNVDKIDQTHPVTRDMPAFSIRDELWHNMKAESTLQVIGSAYSSKKSGGTEKDEAVLIVTETGKGRCFYNVLGHDAETLENVAWQTLMLRGTEWAATGEVTIPIPVNLLWPHPVTHTGSESGSP